MGQNIHNKFDRLQNEIRLAIMDFIINEGRPFNIADDGFRALKGVKLSKEIDFPKIIEVLAEKDGLVINEREDVNFIYPVSALKTHHKVTLSDGRQFYAMCAIDAVGATFTFHQDTEIHSECSVCGEKVYVRMENGRVTEHQPPKLHALTFKLEELVNWAGSC